MKKDTLVIVVAIVLLFAFVNVLLFKFNFWPESHHHNEEAMADHSGHMMPMNVSSERELIDEMIPHHQEAIDTARQILERGATTAEIKELAAGIISAQEKEIIDMKRWYEDWYGVPYADKNSYQPMMRDLSQLSGKELDKAFLTDMVMHHMGAIMMARSVSSYIEHDEIKALTKNIIDSQSKEITEIKQMLLNL